MAAPCGLDWGHLEVVVLRCIRPPADPVQMQIRIRGLGRSSQVRQVLGQEGHPLSSEGPMAGPLARGRRAGPSVSGNGGSRLAREPRNVQAGKDEAT